MASSRLCLSLSGVLLMLGSPAYTHSLNLSDEPLFLGNQVEPNVFFMLDDSGSMDWEFMQQPYWHFCSYDRNAPGYVGNSDCGSYQTDGLYRSYGDSSYRTFYYIYETTDNAYGNGCSRSIEDCDSGGSPVSPESYDWRVFTSSLNTIYYNPNSSYTPYEGPCNSSNTYCADASFTAARSNPYDGSTGYSATIDLGSSAHLIGPAKYHLWIDDKGFDESDGRPKRGTNNNVTSTANEIVDLWDTHYTVNLNSANVTVQKNSYAPDASGLNKTTTTVATLSSSSLCYDILGNVSDIADYHAGTKSFTATDGANCRTIAEAKTNFANWYQYNRRRHMSAKASITSVVQQFPQFRYGISVLNRYNELFIEVPDSSTDTDTHNQTLLGSLYDLPWAAYGTPLRRGLERAGEYFDNDLYGKDDPIINSCQQNFTLLFSDGYWGGSSPSSVIGDADGDGINRTLADVAQYYYDRDLSPLANEVQASSADPATHQHMVTFSIAFGVTGNLEDTDGDGWPNPELENDDNWGNPFYSNSSKVDDMWHAAYNSKGEYISAQDPQSVQEGLTSALSTISNRVASIASVAQNASIISTDTKVYQALFDTNKWSGQLVAYPIASDGSIQAATWDAACILTGGGSCISNVTPNNGKTFSDRVIYTKQSNGSGVLFDYPANYASPNSSTEIDSTQTLLLLNNSPAVVSEASADPYASINPQTYGEQLVDYLKGDSSNNQQSGGTFRIRSSMLGDIIHSTPIFVGAPERVYPDSMTTPLYSSFKTSQASRTEMLYVGANDGMLHGFDADTGEELMAYIPSDRRIYENLPTLAYTSANAPNAYQHKYFVDGSPNAGDVVINSAWKTIVVGGLQGGGQTIYALDVTDPSNFAQTNSAAANTVLWEFNDTDDADLGYTFSRPIIAQVKNGSDVKWAVIFGNGYNSTESDGYASSTGKAALFIAFIEGGLDGTWTINTDYIKIPVTGGTTADPTGLSSPFVVDTNGDFIADVVYAGDLHGKMWRFDISDSTPTNWVNGASLLFDTASSGYGTQEITTQPVVSAHPNGLSQGVMVYFGTGKFLESGDASQSGQNTQTFYGIWDKMDGSTVSRSQLVSQTIESEVAVAVDTDGDGIDDKTYTGRELSNNQISWSTQRGWALDFLLSGNNRGEKVQSNPIVRNGRVIFTTLIPSDSPCDFGGDGWLMEIDAIDGTYLDESPFDLDEDGDYDEGDHITVGDNDGDGNNDTLPPGGIKSEVGITAQPTILLTQDKEDEVKVLSGTSGLTKIQENPGYDNKGRQSWRRLR